MWEVIRDTFQARSTARRTVAISPRTPEAGENTTYYRFPNLKNEVNFKDLNLSIDEEYEEEEGQEPVEDEKVVEHRLLNHADSTNKADILGQVMVSRKTVLKNKLVIILVGLPGRGKTFLCNKLKCYLNWLGHQTGHFNVGTYRRQQKTAEEVQDANFFDSRNKTGIEARERALHAALDDLMNYLQTDQGQVAIFDATNTTKERRQQLINRFHCKVQYLFIESICNDPKVLEANYRYKMMYSPDYRGVSTETCEQALDDFRARIGKYEEVYEEITDRNLHYIKLINMVTGRGHMDINRISGYLPGKIVFFLMQVCKAGLMQARKIWLTRHGESEWNTKHLLGGDSNLSSQGAKYARLLPELLLDRLSQHTDASTAVSVWTSTLRRTIQTAYHLPFPKLRWKALDEIHAGVCDGMTYEDIDKKYPEDFKARKKDKLRYRYPAGESYLDVIQRLEPVIIELEREKECVCIVGHQAVLRAILGYFTAVPPDQIPRLEVPLHTLIELRPRADGTMEVERFATGLPTTAEVAAASSAVAKDAAAQADASPSPSAGTAMQTPILSAVAMLQSTGGDSMDLATTDLLGSAGSSPSSSGLGLRDAATQTNSTSFKQLPMINTSPRPTRLSSSPSAAASTASVATNTTLSPAKSSPC